jgi:hypothetical protein
MSYKPMVHVQGEWAGNDLRFATHEEANESACGLMYRWMLVENCRVDESAVYEATPLPKEKTDAIS